MTVHAQGPYRSAPLSAPEVQRAPRGVRWVALIVAASLVCGGLRGVVVQRSKRPVAVQQRAALIGAPEVPQVGFAVLRDAREFVDARRCVRTYDHAVFCWGRGVALAAGGDEYDVAFRATGDENDGRARWNPNEDEWARWRARDPSSRQIAHDGGACKLTRAGEVWCDDLRPGSYGRIERVPDLGTVISLSTDSTGRCAVTTAGVVQCWSTEHRDDVRTITQFDAPVTSVALDSRELCALDREHRVRCMPLNTYGLALTPTGQSSSLPPPRERSELRGAWALVSIEGQSLCAITGGHQVYCWTSSNSSVGRGDLTTGRSPGAVEGLTGVTSVSLGEGHACALTREGRVRCWGSNFYGERGDEVSPQEREVQAPIEGLRDVVQVDAGHMSTCARTRGGEVWCWGYSARRGGPRRDPSRPARVALPFVAEQVASYREGACARAQEGAVWCWGPWEEPHLIHDVAAQQIVGVRHEMCALTRSGQVRCWRPSHPIEEWPDEPSVVVPITRVRALATGANNHQLCATHTDGSVECLFFSGASYEWNDPHTLQRTAVPALFGATQVVTTGGIGQVYGVDREGTLVTSLPAPERGLRGVRELRAAHGYACAVHQNGTVSCWGTNASGRLGRGATHPELPAPVRVFSQVQQ